MINEQHRVKSGNALFDARPFLGVDVASLKRQEALDYLTERLMRREKQLVAFANTNLLNMARRDACLRAALKHFLILNDGIGLDIASWFKYRRFFPDNLNGTDLTPQLLRATPGARVFLFGASEASVAGAAAFFQRECDVVIAGYQNGYVKDKAQVSEQANAAKADIVLVALGNSLQEKWMAEHRDAIDAPLMLGVGALFDFVSGEKRRAPAWIQKARLEWAMRLVQEPKRLAKRYTTDIARFFFAIAKETLAQGRNPIEKR